MAEHSAAVQEFIDRLVVVLDTELGAPGNGGIDATPLLEGLKSAPQPTGMTHSDDVPGLNHLPQAVRNAQAAPPAARALADTFAEIAPLIPWFQRPEPAFPGFMRGHANAYVIGQKGVETRGKAIVGASLMVPELQYPDHHHPPEELYIVLSDGEWRQNEEPWHTPGPGGLVYNPSNVTHSMRSKSEPLLAVWCLWT